MQLRQLHVNSVRTLQSQANVNGLIAVNHIHRIPLRITKVIKVQHSNKSKTNHRSAKTELLNAWERYEVKVSRTVLRRERGSDAPDLADLSQSEICFLENLILFAFILSIIYYFIIIKVLKVFLLGLIKVSINIKKTGLLFSINYLLNINVIMYAVTPCKVQRGCYTTLH